MRHLLTAALIAAMPVFAFADAWILSGDASKLSFGSIKKDSVGEAHHFTGLSGGVDGEGHVAIEVDLASVETWIDIRNERLAEFVFAGFGPAKLSARIDLAGFEALKPGESLVEDITGELTLGPAVVGVEASVFALKVSADQALITTDEMIFVSVADLGLEAGVATLQELADLPSITRAVPVTFRLMFARGTAVAGGDAAAPVEVAVAGDVKAGAKTFRKCKACHNADKEKNKVGPHLVGVVGRPVGGLESYKYSKVMAGFGGVWTVETLTKFLASPRGYMKGTKMAFGGLKKAAEIENVIAFLAR